MTITKMPQPRLAFCPAGLRARNRGALVHIVISALWEARFPPLSLKVTRLSCSHRLHWINSAVSLANPVGTALAQSRVGVSNRWPAEI
jgi:hypothetical protein